jgi:hypothetical protein
MRVETMQAELRELFAATLPSELAARFSELLGFNPSRWSKIDPWRTWQYLDHQGVSEWTGRAQDLLTATKFSAHAQSEVTVLRCGHDQPSIQRQELRAALIGDSAVFEGFISVVTGRLGIAVNHDGGWCVLSNDT